MSNSTNRTSELIDQLTERVLENLPEIESPKFHNFDTVDDVSYHDFSTYIFALDPWADRSLGSRPKHQPPQHEVVALPDDGLDSPESSTLDAMSLAWLERETLFIVSSALEQARDIMDDPSGFDDQAAFTLIERFMQECTSELWTYYGIQEYVHNRMLSMMIHFVENALPDLLSHRFDAMNVNQRERFMTSFDDATRHWAHRSALVDQPWLGVATMYAGEPSILISPGDQRPATSEATWALDPLSYTLGSGFQAAPYLSSGEASSVKRYHTLAHIETWDSAASCAVPQSSWGGGFFSPVVEPSITFVKPGPFGYPVANQSLLQIADRILEEGPTQETTGALALMQRLSGVSQALAGDLGLQAEPSLTGGQFGFRPYPPRSINLGLEVVYRQEWHPQGMAKGELAKTIPLGPGQVEKVSIRKQERDKHSRQMTDLTESEDSRESTNKTTNSSELVEEASKTRRWEIKADGSFNVAGLFGGTVKGPSYGGTSAANSREMKKDLQEAMSRTASKLRRERKVTVSTEREVTFEETRASEIRNPNDELPVTYYYWTLQQQYEFGTYLASVRPVFFVSEPIPQTIDIAWIRRYAWILGRVLLDASFSDTLARLNRIEPQVMDRQVALAEQQLTATVGALDDARESLKLLHTLPGQVDLAGTYDGMLRAYHEAMKSAQDLIKEYEEILADAQRFAAHLSDSILHYCRAIWSAEDPDRRRMRYHDISIPTQFVPLASQSTGDLRFDFVPASQADTSLDDRVVPLSELLDPTGPVAFAGNYSVFRILANERTLGLSRIVRQAALAYYDDPSFIVAGADATARVVERDLYAWEAFTITFEQDVFSAVQTFSGTVERETLTIETDTSGESGGLILRLPENGVEVRLATVPDRDVTITVKPNRPQLRDPELAHLVANNPDIIAETKERLRGDDVDEIEGLPLHIAGDGTYLRGNERRGFELVQRRTVVIDTDNLYLEIDPQPLLETFKQIHRKLDIALAASDVGRRSGRLALGMYGDPDVDKVVRIVQAGGDGDVVAELADSLVGDVGDVPNPPEDE